MTHTERVILIKGDSTKWYNQAIFIVNKDMPATKMPVDFVAEAEKIIYDHVTKERQTAAQKAAAVPGVYTSHAAHFPTSQSSLPLPAARTGAKKKASRFDFLLNVAMILACVAIVAVLTFGLMP